MDENGNFALFVRGYDDGDWEQLTHWLTYSRCVELRDSPTFFANKKKHIFKMIEDNQL